MLQSAALRTHWAGLVTIGWAVWDGGGSRRVSRPVLRSFALERDLNRLSQAALPTSPGSGGKRALWPMRLKERTELREGSLPRGVLLN